MNVNNWFGNLKTNSPSILPAQGLVSSLQHVQGLQQDGKRPYEQKTFFLNFENQVTEFIKQNKRLVFPPDSGCARVFKLLTRFSTQKTNNLFILSPEVRRV